MRANAISAELESGGLRLVWPDAAWSGVCARCITGDGAEHAGGAWSRIGDKPVFSARCGPLDLELEVRTVEHAVELRVAATVREAAAIRELALVGVPEVAGTAPLWVAYDGYQSWDPSGVVPAGGTSAAGRPVRRESWWTIGLVGGDGSGLAAAASSAERSAVRFEHADERLSIAWCEADGLQTAPVAFELAPGSTWIGDRVRVTAGSDIRSELATLSGQPRRPDPPRGWLSWYHYGPWVSAEDVDENSALLASPAYRDLGYRLIQVDDGWQQAWGDWRPNTKFPGGLEAVAKQLSARGQTLGIWTAPFLVSASAELADEAPAEWFLNDPATGERAVDPRHMIFGPMHVLDPRQPGVLEHLRNTFHRLRAAGAGYFKIDFLYAGAYAGTEAYRAGMAAIREGAGDSYILASGAPLLPSVGLVEGCRVGQDTATPVYDFEEGKPKPSIFGDEVLWVARNLAARSCLGGWFQLDADVALVGGNLSLDQGRQLVSLVALSGGPFFASDDLNALPEERLALLTNPEVLELIGKGPARPDWEPGPSDRPPAVWRMGDVVGLFNWLPEDREMTLTIPGPGSLRDLWERRDLGTFEREVKLAVPAGGVRVVRASTG
jgi:alpha-galactosidase